MKTKTISTTTILPLPEEDVYNLLKKLDTLKYVAKPYVSFRPYNDTNNEWKEGCAFRLKVKLFGFIPYGMYIVHIIKFDDVTHEIFTNEINTHIPIWNHRIKLDKISEYETKYTDEVEIGAGFKTFIVSLWAKNFFKHRHKRWIKLIKEVYK